MATRQCDSSVSRTGGARGPPAQLHSTRADMKHKFTYTPITYIGDCTRCGETHLAETLGDKLIDDKPVCAACIRSLRATERSEGARTTERSEGVSERR